MVWICVCLWAFCLSWSLCLTVDPMNLLGFNFNVCMCLLVKLKQKQSRKYDPFNACVASQKQNRNIQVFILYLFVVYNSFIVYVYNGNLLWQMSNKEVKFKVHYGGTFLWNPSLEYFGEKFETVYKDLIGLVILKYKVYMRN